MNFVQAVLETGQVDGAEAIRIRPNLSVVKPVFRRGLSEDLNWTEAVPTSGGIVLAVLAEEFKAIADILIIYFRMIGQTVQFIQTRINNFQALGLPMRSGF